MTRRIKNWPAFWRSERNRQQQAMAEGQSRPAPLIVTSQDDPTVVKQQDQDTEQDEGHEGE
ncbi:hypothetical protein AB0F30_33325 [Streptomyces sp. NPDC029006]|uniref:hypothetical protein n=1 Tax=Streptomyces sp. NPDC029006 TaxID=3155467 RepID=UPI0033F5F121